MGRIGVSYHSIQGMPDYTVLRAFTDFVVSFDTRLRNPRWVLEHIDRRKGRGEANRCVQQVEQRMVNHPSGQTLTFSMTAKLIPGSSAATTTTEALAMTGGTWYGCAE